MTGQRTLHTIKAAGIEPSEQQLSALLPEYVDARQQESDQKDYKDELGALFREWLEKHPDDYLKFWEEGQPQVTAQLKERRGPQRYDVWSMPDKLIAELARAHCLLVDNAVLDALAGKAALYEDAKPFRVPPMISTYIDVRVRDAH